MQKMLLLSILVANIVLPLWFAADPSPRRGARRTIGAVFSFNVLYLLALLFIYPQLAD